MTNTKANWFSFPLKNRAGLEHKKARLPLELRVSIYVLEEAKATTPTPTRVETRMNLLSATELLSRTFSLSFRLRHPFHPEEQEQGMIRTKTIFSKQRTQNPQKGRRAQKASHYPPHRPLPPFSHLICRKETVWRDGLHALASHSFQNTTRSSRWISTPKRHVHTHTHTLQGGHAMILYILLRACNLTILQEQWFNRSEHETRALG